MPDFRDRIKELRRVRASELIPDERNWRKHPEAQRRALTAMMERVGIVDAVMAREDDEGRLILVDGHLRQDIAGDAELSVLIVDLDESEAGEVLATFDPLSAMAERDDAQLKALVQLLPQDDSHLLGVLESLHADLPVIPPAGIPRDPDAPVESIPDPVSKRGDVWLLGRHRLMCGDSTDAGDVARLLDGSTPRLMVTDLPYGVDYDPAWRNGQSLKSLGYSRRLGKVQGDDTFDFSDSLRLSPAPVVYVWTASLYVANTQEVLISGGYEPRAQIIWRKQQAVVSRGHYHWQHEPLWYAVRQGETAGWIGDRKQSTIWDIPNTNPFGANAEATTIHSTQKPVECMERPICNHEGDVYDPFVGSGTTLIAAERQGRACYAMEIEPHYVDMAVKRWEEYTGEKAELVT